MKVHIVWAYDDVKKRPNVRTIHKTRLGAKAEKDKHPNNPGYIVSYPVKD